VEGARVELEDGVQRNRHVGSLVSGEAHVEGVDDAEDALKMSAVTRGGRNSTWCPMMSSGSLQRGEGRGDEGGREGGKGRADRCRSISMMTGSIRAITSR
jgi:hypothetical protein